MIRGSEEGATIFVEKVPFYEGAIPLAELGVESTLKPENIKVNHEATNEIKANARYQLCFDPQTSGGLMATIKASIAQKCLKKLHESGYTASTIIGHISDVSEDITIC